MELESISRSSTRSTSGGAEPGDQPVNAPNTLLEVDQLSVRFGSTEVLRNLTFSVSHGSALAIIGPNGVGKSVLLRTLVGSVPHSGTIRWAPGTRIGYVPQKLDLDRDIPMTGNDFARARLALTGESDASTSRTFELVGLSPQAAEQRSGTMSGGQFQRLLIAFALVGRPTMLMLDEPTAGIDEPGQEQLSELLQHLQQAQALTSLSISHDLSVVYHYADQVLCLGRRKAVIGPPRRS
jgi:zinc transport system ATP-binding protein